MPVDGIVLQRASVTAETLQPDRRILALHEPAHSGQRCSLAAGTRLLEPRANRRCQPSVDYTDSSTGTKHHLHSSVGMLQPRGPEHPLSATIAGRRGRIGRNRPPSKPMSSREWSRDPVRCDGKRLQAGARSISEPRDGPYRRPEQDDGRRRRAAVSWFASTRR
jgi:hypothetical protein